MGYFKRECYKCKKMFYGIHATRNFKEDISPDRRNHFLELYCNKCRKLYHRRLYERKLAQYGSVKNEHKRKAKSQKRLCVGYKVFADCKKYIDNANRRFCSVCHTNVSTDLIGENDVYFNEIDSYDGCNLPSFDSTDKELLKIFFKTPKQSQLQY